MITINLILIFKAIGFLLIAWFANLIPSLYYNTKIIQEEFCWKRFTDGLIRLGVIVAVTASLSILITAFPPYLISLGIAIPEEVIGYFNIVAIIMIFAGHVFSYTKQAYLTLDNMLNGIKPPTYEQLKQ